MRFRTTVIALIFGLIGVFALTGQSWAAKGDVAVHKIEALNEAAIARNARDDRNFSQQGIYIP